MVTLTVSAPSLTWSITLEGVSSAGSARVLASRETGVTLEWAITKTPAARQTRGNAVDQHSCRMWGSMFRLARGLRPSSYRREWLAKDVVAGIVLSTLLVPQGMAYAELAGLPPITGLYTSILCLRGYAVFGPSRVLVLGPDSSLGPMIAATILPLIGANGDPQRAVELASMLALITGLITMGAGIARLGFVADLLSKPTQMGYMNGLALTILVGQLPKLFGFSIDADGLIDEARGFVNGLSDGDPVSAAGPAGWLSLGRTRVL